MLFQPPDLDILKYYIWIRTFWQKLTGSDLNTRFRIRNPDDRSVNKNRTLATGSLMEKVSPTQNKDCERSASNDDNEISNKLVLCRITPLG